MTKKEYHKYLKTEKWEAVRRAVMKQAGYACQLCNSGIDLVAHHRTYRNIGNELNNLDDLTCLCKRCHEHFHCVTKIKLDFEEPLKSKKAKNKSRASKKAEKELEYRKQQDISLPDADPVTLTRFRIDNLKTDAGAFTSATIKHLIPLGVKIHSKGWTSRLVGKQMPLEDYLKAAEGRNYFK